MLDVAVYLGICIVVACVAVGCIALGILFARIHQIDGPIIPKDPATPEDRKRADD